MPSLNLLDWPGAYVVFSNGRSIQYLLMNEQGGCWGTGYMLRITNTAFNPPVKWRAYPLALGQRPNTLSTQIIPISMNLLSAQHSSIHKLTPSKKTCLRHFPYSILERTGHLQSQLLKLSMYLDVCLKIGQPVALPRGKNPGSPFIPPAKSWANQSGCNQHPQFSIFIERLKSAMVPKP